MEAFEEHSLLSGKIVRVKIAGRMISGRVVSLAEDGSLIVEDTESVRHRVIAGEVHVLEEQE